MSEGVDRVIEDGVASEGGVSSADDEGGGKDLESEVSGDEFGVEIGRWIVVIDSSSDSGG